MNLFVPLVVQRERESVILTLVHFSFQMPRLSYIYKTYNWKRSRAVHPRDEKCLNQPSAREYFKFPVEQFGYFLTPTTSYPLAATLHLHFNFIITVDLVGKYETVKEEFSYFFASEKFYCPQLISLSIMFILCPLPVGQIGPSFLFAQKRRIEWKKKKKTWLHETPAKRRLTVGHRLLTDGTSVSG